MVHVLYFYLIAGNTTNFQFHLETHHKLSTGLSQNDEKSKQAGGTQRKIDKVYKNIPARFTQTQQNNIDDALMQLMVSKVLPLSLVENEKFLNFVGLLDSRYYLLTIKLLFVLKLNVEFVDAVSLPLELSIRQFYM